MNALYQATVEMGVTPQVTSFTLSDFGRTFLPDSTAGTDHAWGSLHMITGGAVAGGLLLARFPTQELGGPDDEHRRGGGFRRPRWTSPAQL